MTDTEKTEAEKAAEAKAAEAKEAEEAAAKAEAEKPKGKDGNDFDPERAQRAIEAARAAEKKAKDEARELRDKAKKWDEAEEANQSELEKAQKAAEKAQAKADAADAKLQRANLIAELADPELGIVNARAAAKLIEGVEYDDSGEPTNLGSPDDEESLIAKFLAENEYLRGKPAKPKAPSTDANEGGDDKAPQLTAEELEAARKAGLTPEEYAIYKNGGSLADLQEAGLSLETKT